MQLFWNFFPWVPAKVASFWLDRLLAHRYDSGGVQRKKTKLWKIKWNYPRTDYMYPSCRKYYGDRSRFDLLSIGRTLLIFSFRRETLTAPFLFFNSRRRICHGSTSILCAWGLTVKLSLELYQVKYTMHARTASGKCTPLGLLSLIFNPLYCTHTPRDMHHAALATPAIMASIFFSLRSRRIE